MSGGRAGRRGAGWCGAATRRHFEFVEDCKCRRGVFVTSWRESKRPVSVRRERGYSNSTKIYTDSQ